MFRKLLYAYYINFFPLIIYINLTHLGPILHVFSRKFKSWTNWLIYLYWYEIVQRFFFSLSYIITKCQNDGSLLVNFLSYLSVIRGEMIFGLRDYMSIFKIINIHIYEIYEIWHSFMSSYMLHPLLSPSSC